MIEAPIPTPKKEGFVNMLSYNKPNETFLAKW